MRRVQAGQGRLALARTRFAACLALASAAAAAEPEHSGRWLARFSSDGAEHCAALLAVDVDRGSWTALPPACRPWPAACAGRAFGARLAGSGSSTVTLSIDARRADRRCADRRARLTVVDADTLEGEFDDGRVLRLERIAGPSP